MKALLAAGLATIVLSASAAAQDGPFLEPPIVTETQIYCANSALTLCGARCVDTMSHPQHCGGCGQTCSGGAICQEGACVNDEWNFRRGFEVGAAIGGGIPLTDTSRSPVERYDVDSDTGFFDSRLPWGATDPYSGGLRLRLEVGFRVGSFGIGFRYAHNAFSASEAFDGSGLDVSFRERVMQLWVRPRLARLDLGPLNGEIYFDIAVGGARFKQSFGDQVNLETAGLGANAALGFDLSVISTLRVGIRLGAGINMPITGSSDFGEVDDFSGAPLGHFEALLTARYIIPWGRVAPEYRDESTTVVPEQRQPRQVIAMVEARFEMSQGGEQAQVTQTDRYRTSRENYQRVAVAAPTDCARESVSAATGGVARAANPNVLYTDCGVEMAELERALAEKGYIVTSWRTLAQTNTLPLNAARQFGADVLFQVNSLERTRMRPGESSSLTWRYFRSDADGQRLDPLPMVDADRQALQRLFAGPVAQYAQQEIVPSATLDTTAVDVSSGETVWLYRQTTIDPETANYSFERLAAGTERLQRQTGEAYLDWRITQRRQTASEQAQAETFSTSDQTVGSVGTRAANPLRERQFELLRGVIRDFVEKFQTGSGS